MDCQFFREGEAHLLACANVASAGVAERTAHLLEHLLYDFRREVEPRDLELVAPPTAEPAAKLHPSAVLVATTSVGSLRVSVELNGEGLALPVTPAVGIELARATWDVWPEVREMFLREVTAGDGA